MIYLQPYQIQIFQASEIVAIDFKNIQKIELIKCPQGSAFGKNSESGVINIYTKEPTDKFENELLLGYSYNSKDLYRFVSSPLSKDLSCAISITKSQSDGYAKNTLR